MKLFSVDDHIVEPADVWSSRLPSRFREAGPHVVEEDSREYWVYEDQRVETMGLNAVAGKPKDQWSNEPTRFSDMRPGCYQPADRVKDLLQEGVTSSVAFPTLPRFGGALFPSFKDKELADLSVRAWNDFIFEEWCPTAPEMFVPMFLVQLWNPDLIVDEIERNLQRGAKAICIPEDTSHLGLPSYYDPIWEPMWAACEEAALPICMHIGSSGWMPYTPPGASDTLWVALLFVPTVTHAMAMVFGPVPRKHPGLKFVYSEGGIGWIPHALERADSRYELRKGFSGDDDLKPSEVFERNIWCCVMPDEKLGLDERHQIGVEKIFWELDYPHSNAPWPGTEALTKQQFDGIPQDEFDMITHKNAEMVFNWECPSKEDMSDKYVSG